MPSSPFLLSSSSTLIIYPILPLLPCVPSRKRRKSPPPPSSSPPTPGTKNLLVGAAHKILSITRRCRSGYAFNIFLPLLLLSREPRGKLFIIFSCDLRSRRPSALFRSGIIKMAKRRRLLLFCRTLPPTIFPSNIKVVDPHSNDDDRASHPSQRVVRSRAPIPSQSRVRWLRSPVHFYPCHGLLIRVPIRAREEEAGNFVPPSSSGWTRDGRWLFRDIGGRWWS